MVENRPVINMIFPGLIPRSEYQISGRGRLLFPATDPMLKGSKSKSVLAYYFEKIPILQCKNTDFLRHYN